MTSHTETLRAEASSWILEDPERQREKLSRERIRHFRLVKDLLLVHLPTATYDVLDVGGGPLPVSDLIPVKSRIVVDPLTETYRMITACNDHVAMNAEDMSYVSCFDLCISTNALDHTADPRLVVEKMVRALRPGGYLAIVCAHWNSITHVHEAHAHSLDAELIKRWTAADFEVVQELTYEKDDYRYGHRLFEGRRGQPALALLLRRCSGY